MAGKSYPCQRGIENSTLDTLYKQTKTNIEKLHTKSELVTLLPLTLTMTIL